ncbi:MAG: YfiR family protein [Desulfobulbaceae bacterium]|nr:YfiR family protein [Desulfobulbaceae bacterium]HIJ89432.1 YfiR family protein [Deltaproteobacteria bacterium]
MLPTPSTSPASRRSLSVSAATTLYRALFLLVSLLLLTPQSARAAGDFAEYEVKAGFLFNFFNFITLPAAASTQRPMLLVVLDTGPVGASIAEALGNETVLGRPLKVLTSENPDDARQADMVFVPAAYPGKPLPIPAALSGRPIITVGESPDFLNTGGIINFVRQGNKIRFEINPQAAQRAGLKISSQLLRLAIIKNEPHSLNRPDPDAPADSRRRVNISSGTTPQTPGT